MEYIRVYAYRFTISGKVQGVSYRKAIQQVCSLIQLRGYIKNLKSSDVEVVVELYEDQLDEFLEILKNGSPLSVVEDIKYVKLENDDLLYDGFEIR